MKYSSLALLAVALIGLSGCMVVPVGEHEGHDRGAQHDGDRDHHDDGDHRHDCDPRVYDCERR